MKAVTYGGAKSVLLSDEAARMLLEYSAVLANAGRADTVELQALGTNGDEITVMLLLNAGTTLFSETVTADVTPPENMQSVEYMRERVELSSPLPLARPVESFPWDTFEGPDLYS